MARELALFAHRLSIWLYWQRMIICDVCWLLSELGFVAWVFIAALSGVSIAGLPAQSRAGQEMATQEAQNVQIRTNTGILHELNGDLKAHKEMTSRAFLDLQKQVDGLKALAESARDTAEETKRIQYAILLAILVDVIRRWIRETPAKKTTH